MADPSDKFSDMEGFLDELSALIHGNTRTDAIGADTCVSCGKGASLFTDDLSKKEYGISGLCQACQDDVFG